MTLILNRGNWAELKMKLKKEYPQLTDTDLQHKKGMEENMLTMVEYKLSKTKAEMRSIIAGMGYFPSEL